MGFETILAPVVGAVVSKAFGKKSSSPSSAAQAAATSAPTQTPEQKRMAEAVMPALEGWMTNPPKINLLKPTQTRINYGGNQSGATGFFGSGGNVQSNGQNSFSGSSGGPGNQTMTQQVFSSNVNGGRFGNQIPGVGSFASTNQAIQTPVTTGFAEPQTVNISSAPASRATLGTAGTYQPIFQNADAGYQGLDYSALLSSFLTPVEAQSAQQNPYGTYQQQDYQSMINALGQNPNGAFQQKDYQTLINALGQNPNGTYQQKNYQTFINKLGQNPNGAYQDRNYNPQIAALTQNEFGSYQQQDYQPQISDITGYQNNLSQNAATKAGEGLDRQFREGYDANYLKDLAASQIDPLKELYQEAIRQSTADFNRRGLSGSGFESLEKYGSDDNSLTTRFMKEAANVQRDVALRGAEAAREDQYRNAQMQNEAIGLANNLGQSLSAEQLNRTQTGLNALMQQNATNEANRQYWDANQLNKNQAALSATMQQDAANEANRQYWNADQLNRTGAELDANMQQDTFNESNRQYWNADQLNRTGAKLDATMQQNATNESNRQYWDANQLNRNQVDYSRAMDQKNLLQSGMGMLMDQNNTNESNRQFWANYDTNLAQQNESNRQYWSEFLNSQNMYDQQQEVADWARNTDMLKWLIGREDDLINRQQAAYVNQQSLDYDVLKDGINQLLSFISGQAPIASNMQQNYWNAYKAQVDQNNANQTYNQGIANTVADVFGKIKF